MRGLNAGARVCALLLLSTIAQQHQIAILLLGIASEIASEW